MGIIKDGLLALKMLYCALRCAITIVIATTIPNIIVFLADAFVITVATVNPVPLSSSLTPSQSIQIYSSAISKRLTYFHAWA
ncbi:unnamed protein product [Gongylonema pulchrum]|uniref:G_PROTEIN_RECEP_F1_2 domain-containing protein n=1 Tax=Gongylonema pulchrum TaxID=637853 RepID=A0A183DV05_9BILA|nr:unnamed protein product [Gongylonema pulchrum]